MNDSVLQNCSLYIGLQNCQTGLLVCLLAYFKPKLYNEDVHMTEKTHKVFLFSPLRAAWYRKVALCFWTCEQPSRPF
jgi:hypothetical protein